MNPAAEAVPNLDPCRRIDQHFFTVFAENAPAVGQRRVNQIARPPHRLPTVIAGVAAGVFLGDRRRHFRQPLPGFQVVRRKAVLRQHRLVVVQHLGGAVGGQTVNAAVRPGDLTAERADKIGEVEAVIHIRAQVAQQFALRQRRSLRSGQQRERRGVLRRHSGLHFLPGFIVIPLQRAFHHVLILTTVKFVDQRQHHLLRLGAAGIPEVHLGGSLCLHGQQQRAQRAAHKSQPFAYGHHYSFTPLSEKPDRMIRWHNRNKNSIGITTMALAAMIFDQLKP